MIPLILLVLIQISLSQVLRVDPQIKRLETEQKKLDDFVDIIEQNELQIHKGIANGKFDKHHHKHEDQDIRDEDDNYGKILLEDEANFREIKIPGVDYDLEPALLPIEMAEINEIERESRPQIEEPPIETSQEERSQTSPQEEGPQEEGPQELSPTEKTPLSEHLYERPPVEAPHEETEEEEEIHSNENPREDSPQNLKNSKKRLDLHYWEKNPPIDYSHGSHSPTNSREYSHESLPQSDRTTETPEVDHHYHKHHHHHRHYPTDNPKNGVFTQLDDNHKINENIPPNNDNSRNEFNEKVRDPLPPISHSLYDNSRNLMDNRPEIRNEGHNEDHLGTLPHSHIIHENEGNDKIFEDHFHSENERNLPENHSNEGLNRIHSTNEPNSEYIEDKNPESYENINSEPKTSPKSQFYIIPPKDQPLIRPEINVEIPDYNRKPIEYISDIIPLLPMIHPNNDQNNGPNNVPNNEPNNEPNYEPNNEPNYEPNNESNGEPNSEPNGEPNSEPNSGPITDPNNYHNSDSNSDHNSSPNNDPNSEPNNNSDPKEDDPNHQNEMQSIPLPLEVGGDEDRIMKYYEDQSKIDSKRFTSLVVDSPNILKSEQGTPSTPSTPDTPNIAWTSDAPVYREHSKKFENYKNTNRPQVIDENKQITKRMGLSIDSPNSEEQNGYYYPIHFSKSSDADNGPTRGSREYRKSQEYHSYEPNVPMNDEEIPSDELKSFYDQWTDQNSKPISTQNLNNDNNYENRNKNNPNINVGHINSRPNSPPISSRDYEMSRPKHSDNQRPDSHNSDGLSYHDSDYQHSHYHSHDSVTPHHSKRQEDHNQHKPQSPDEPHSESDSHSPNDNSEDEGHEEVPNDDRRYLSDPKINQANAEESDEEEDEYHSHDHNSGPPKSPQSHPHRHPQSRPQNHPHSHPHSHPQSHPSNNADSNSHSNSDERAQNNDYIKKKDEKASDNFDFDLIEKQTTGKLDALTPQNLSGIAENYQDFDNPNGQEMNENENPEQSKSDDESHQSYTPSPDMEGEDQPEYEPQTNKHFEPSHRSQHSTHTYGRQPSQPTQPSHPSDYSQSFIRDKTSVKDNNNPNNDYSQNDDYYNSNTPHKYMPNDNIMSNKRSNDDYYNHNRRQPKHYSQQHYKDEPDIREHSGDRSQYYEEKAATADTSHLRADPNTGILLSDESKVVTQTNSSKNQNNNNNKTLDIKSIDSFSSWVKPLVLKTKAIGVDDTNDTKLIELNNEKEVKQKTETKRKNSRNISRKEKMETKIREKNTINSVNTSHKNQTTYDLIINPNNKSEYQLRANSNPMTTINQQLVRTIRTRPQRSISYDIINFEKNSDHLNGNQLSTHSQNSFSKYLPNIWTHMRNKSKESSITPPKCSQRSLIKNFCLEMDEEYPLEMIRRNIIRNLENLRSVYRRMNSSVTNEHYFQDSTDSLDSCRAHKLTIRPLRAKNINGEWKVIANIDNLLEQKITLTNCSEELKDSETNGPKYFKKCVQKYSLKELITYNSESTDFEIDIFVVPNACSPLKTNII